VKKTFWEKRIPTLLGICIIVIGIGFTTFLTNKGVITFGRAALSETPENILISNISDTSFTVSYTTAIDVLGSLSFGKDKNLGATVFDDRDQGAQTVTARKTHHITLRSLQPNTKYVFAIISGKTTFLHNNQLFEATTGSTLETQPTSQQPISGNVLLPDGSSPKDAIVYLTASGIQTLSTLLGADGNYLLPLNTVRSDDLQSYALFAENATLKILVVSPLGKSNATILATQSKSVPPVTLTNDYDFTINTNPIASVSAYFGFPTFSATPSATASPQILSPRKEEGLSDQKPLFKGTASPGATIKVIIHSDEQITTQVTADNNGTWTFRPDQNLSPGQHTVTITTTDPFGVLRTITQSFTVFAQGSQVNQSATPSATPVVTITPTIIPSKTPSPTIQPLGTITQTASQSPTAIPTFVILPTTTPVQPGSASVVSLGFFAIAAVTVGLLLFFLSKGGISSL